MNSPPLSVPLRKTYFFFLAAFFAVFLAAFLALFFFAIVFSPPLLRGFRRGGRVSSLPFEGIERFRSSSVSPRHMPRPDDPLTDDCYGELNNYKSFESGLDILDVA